jgi:alkyl hydroperoxide reductase subunit AhpC
MIFFTFDFGKVFGKLLENYKIMKKLSLLFAFSTLLFLGHSQTEEKHENTGKKIPSVSLKNMAGKTVNTADLGIKGPIVISFWATWCAPCKKELNAIQEVYEDWQQETGVTLVAVSVDDEKTKSRVPVDVNGKGWDYVILMDPNGDFKRAMGVNNVPHTFLIDKDGNIVYSHNNYAPGDEEKLYQEIKKLSGK